MRRVAECELKGAEEDATKASAGTLVLACRFADWPRIVCSGSTHAGKVEDDLSSGLEAQLMADDVEELVFLLFRLMEKDRHRPLSEQ